MKRSNFFAFAAGILLAGSMWYIRELPMWDDRVKYSDTAYNTMLSITGALIVLGVVGVLFGVYGIVKGLTEKR